MNRLESIIEFINFDSKDNIFIENKNRETAIIKEINSLISSYSPSVIVKAGLGNGKLLNEISSDKKILFVIVEPSIEIIKNYISTYNHSDNIKFINGDFSNFPVDYFKADLLLCIDYLNFSDSGMAIDEFQRVLKFEAHLFIATTVLHDKDLDGIYDDFFRLILPVHNDFYIKEDLNTFLELNNFKNLNSQITSYNYNLNLIIENLEKKYTDLPEYENFIKENEKVFKDLYDLKDGHITLPYFTGAYFRQKPKETEV